MSRRPIVARFRARRERAFRIRCVARTILSERDNIKLATAIEIELFRAGNVEPRRSIRRIQSGEIFETTSPPIKCICVN